LDFPMIASHMTKIRAKCLNLFAKEQEKLRKDQDYIPRLVTAVNLKPIVGNAENWSQALCKNELIEARALGKRLVVDLGIEKQYGLADMVWQSLRCLHDERIPGLKATGSDMHYSTLARLANDAITASKNEEVDPWSEEENLVLAHISGEQVHPSLVPDSGYEGAPLTKQVMEHCKEKKARKEKHPVFPQETCNLSPETSEKLLQMGTHMQGASDKLKTAMQTRDACTIGALGQHYYTVEDQIEETGLAALTLLTIAKEEPEQPWYSGRQAAQEVFDACQRMALTEIRLQNRVSKRPSAENEAAPVPPPWYLCSQGEYFTGSWRGEELLLQGTPRFEDADNRSWDGYRKYAPVTPAF